jgi:hypothetical protein
MTWIDDGMPVIGKKDPGSEEESVVSTSRVERFCQLLEVSFGQQISASGQPGGHEEVMVRHIEPP